MNSHPPHGQIHLYIDHQLDPPERNSVRRHLAECAACTRTLEEFRALRSAVAKAADVELPYAFELRIRRAVELEGSSDQSWGGVETVARNAVAAIALFVLIAFILNSLNASAQDLPTETMMVVGQADSVSARVFTKQGEISRDDLVYAVVSR